MQFHVIHNVCAVGLDKGMLEKVKNGKCYILKRNGTTVVASAGVYVYVEADIQS